MSDPDGNRNRPFFPPVSAHWAEVPRWIWFAPAVALLLAILPLSGFTIFLIRLLVTATAGYIAWKEHVLNAGAPTSYTWVFGGIAVFFNPVFPVSVGWSLWLVACLFGAACFAGHLRLRAARS